MKIKMLMMALLTAASGAFASQTPDFRNPDFDYPQTVITDAAPNLKPGVADDLRFLAMIETAKATTDIDPDSVYVLPAFIAAQRAACKDNAYKALYDLYEVKVLSQILSSNMHKISEVVAPLQPIQSDVRRWSQEQFNHVIDSLSTRALVFLDSSVGNRSIVDFSNVIETPDALSRIFFPTLRDFGYAMLINRTTDSSKLLARIISLSVPGSPSWAYWKSVEGQGLLEAYKKYSKGLTGAQLLSSLNNKGIVEQAEYVGMLREYLNREPENELTQSLKSTLEQLTRATVSITVPELVAPGIPFDVKFSYAYITKIKVEIYKLKQGAKRSRPFTPSQSNSTLVISREIASNRDTGDATDKFTVDADGTYYIKVVVDNDEKERRGQFFTASTYVPFMVSWNNFNSLAVVKAIDGSPLKDATVIVGGTPLGKTNGEGIFTFPIKGASYARDKAVTVHKNGVEYDFGGNLNVGNTRYGATNNDLSAKFFIERPIYHPGDTVKWAAVLGRWNDAENRAAVCPDIDVTVVAYDTNSEPVDTVKTTTDTYGRINGSFAIPTDRLTGRYYMRIISTSYKNRQTNVSGSSFMVSDFKAPVFEVKDLKTDIADDGSVKLTGKAMTYSGMPVAEANVDVNMTPYFSWWWRRIYSGDYNYNELKYNTTTDGEGAFAITVPADSLTPGANYRISVKVTSAAAETADAYISATLDKTIAVTYQGPSMWNTDNDALMPIYATTSDDKRVSRQARWQLFKDSKAIAEGDCDIKPEGTDIDLAPYPADNYKLYIAPTDTVCCISDTIEISTYSIKNNSVPADVKGFMPKPTVTVKAGEKGKIMIGCGAKTVAYVFVTDEATITSSERHNLKPGFNEIETPAVKAGETLRLTIAIHDGVKFIEERAAVVGIQPENVKLTIESWRDNIVPGTPETITLKLHNLDGTPMAGALVATMYNHALDALMPGFSYDINGSLVRSPRMYHGVTTGPYLRDNYLYYAGKLPRRRPAVLTRPEFKYLPQAYGYVVFGATMMRSAAAAGVNNYSLSVDDAEYAVAETEYEAAPAPAMKQAQSTADTGGAVEEAIEEGSAEDVQLRQGTVYSALWQPTLLFNADGTATVTYIVPDANGTWSFLAAAWTEAAYGTNITKSAVSSKPLMVQPALPRYLRSGDKATARVTIFNNSEAAGTASVVITTTAGGQSKSVEQSVEIEAGKSAIVPFEIAYPAESADVVVKVVARMGDYSDGQQDILPVLASDMTVIDSETFYLTDAKPSFETTLPARGSSTLTYCANPVWDVVKAVPALLDPRPTTATGAANSIYGALTARGLSRSFPEINRAIDIWMSSPEDSALVSRLYKNEELKMATLQQTPWQWVAGSETQRMQRLAVTFDKNQIKSTLDGSVKTLESLQNGDGGFSWGPWSTGSSFWVTAQVLSSIGRLNAWGYLNGNSRLDNIIERAFKYLDNNVEDREIAYAMVASLYPSRKPTTQAAVSAITAGAQMAVKEWHKSPTAVKARYALMLDATGYTPVARQIMESISQFEVNSPLAGISFPSVSDIDSYATIMQAFAKIAPSTERLDAMRQWLVLRTQVTDDLGSWNPTSLINAILATGSRWTTLDASMPALTINGNSPELSDVEKITGTFSVTVDTSAPALISVSRPAGGGVSYGSVSTVYDQDMREVKPRGSSEISIEKTFLVADGDNWKEADAFTLGQAAKVRLYVTVSRDMEYVTIIDDRSAAFEPADQLPGYVRSGAVSFYRESKDSQTRMFIDYLPKGTYYITYDVTAATQGSFASGPATVQSQYAPELNARSGSCEITVTAK